jgi:predicted RecA/RadA family phage recombinase
MNNEIQDGKRITWTNGTGAAVSAGDPVVIGNQIGVACVDIANAANGAVAMEGVFELPKVAGTAWTLGAELLYDVSGAAFDLGTATPATGDVSVCCVAWNAAAAAATVGYVKINVGVGTVA